MYYVYYLRSQKDGRIYIGSTENVEKRLALHNRGAVRSTKAFGPWKLLGSEKFKTRSAAVIRERFLKSGQQRELLKQEYGPVAK